MPESGLLLALSATGAGTLHTRLGLDIAAVCCVVFGVSCTEMLSMQGVLPEHISRPLHANCSG